MRKIINVKALYFILECEMENGEVFQYDMNYVKSENSPMISPLKDLDFFQKVFLELGSLSWPNGYEIHANTVASEGVLISKAS